jgi:hypothetical protein
MQLFCCFCDVQRTGVWSAEPIPKLTRFGPLVGELVQIRNREDLADAVSKQAWIVSILANHRGFHFVRLL